MFKMGCSMARKILPGSSSSGNGSGGGGDGASQQAACFSLGGQLGKSSGGRTSENSSSVAGPTAAAASQQNQDGHQPKRVANSSELNDFSKLEDDPRLPLNVRQIFKITKSWKAIARTMSKTGTAMFLNLFEQNEDLFHLFDRFQHLKGKELHESMELREHAATVMSTLDTSINSLSDYDNFVTYLHSIGELHRKVPGFKREYFWKIEQPFMKAVKQTLDERCNETIEEIYKIAIKLIIETIADGYGQDGGGQAGGGPVTSNERRDGDGAINGGDGGTQPGGNNNNKSGGGGGGKSGNAMAPHEPSGSGFGAAGGQHKQQRQHKVRQTKTTITCTSAATQAHNDFTKSVSDEILNQFACPARTNSIWHSRNNNGHHGPFIISESQSHEKEGTEKGDNKNNGSTSTTNNNNIKYLMASRLYCTIKRNQILVLTKTKRVLHCLQSTIVSRLTKTVTRTTGKSDADFTGHNQNLETIDRPQDQDEHKDNLGDLVLSTCRLLETTSKLIEERVQSQCEKQGTMTNSGSSKEEDELARLIKWRGLLTELTDGSGVDGGSGSLTTMTGGLQDSWAQRGTTPSLKAQTHPTAHDRKRFNIRSGTNSFVRIPVPTGANDNGNCNPLVSQPSESAERNYNLPLASPATEPVSDLLAIAGHVTGESKVGLNGGAQTMANDEPVLEAQGASSATIGLTYLRCPHNETPQEETRIVWPVAEYTTATATRTNMIRLASVSDDEAPMPGAGQLAAVKSAVLCARPDADSTNTPTNQVDDSSSADLVDFIKLLLMINNLILASGSLTDQTNSTIPQSSSAYTTICPQIRV